MHLAVFLLPLSKRGAAHLTARKITHILAIIIFVKLPILQTGCFLPLNKFSPGCNTSVTQIQKPLYANPAPFSLYKCLVDKSIQVAPYVSKKHRIFIFALIIL